MRFPVFIFCLLSTGLFAQTADSARVRILQFGVLGGVGFHEVDFRPNVNTEPLEGRRYGVGVRYFDNHLVGVQAELSYVEAGWLQELEDPFTEDYVRRSRYVEFTALTQLSVGRGAVQPMLQAGPYLAYPLGDDEEIPEGFTGPSGVLPSYVGRPLDRRLNYGLRAGGGLNLSFGRILIQLEGYYLAGFNDLIKAGETVVVVSRRTGFGGGIGIFYGL